MKPTLILAFAVAAATTSLSAQAEVITAQFTGNVQAQNGAGFTLDAPVTGQFSYDTASSKFLTFSVGGFAVADGFASSAEVTPDQYSALYEAQLSPQPGNVLNSTFTLDLEGLDKWPGFDAIALLTNTSALPGNLDFANSSFGFYIANSDGTNIQSMTAGLVSLAVTAVPEPGSWSLALAGLAALGARTRRRKA